MSEATVEIATDAEVDSAVADLLSDLGTTYEELSKQAAEGRFVSGRAREAWFVVAALSGKA